MYIYIYMYVCVWVIYTHIIFLLPAFIGSWVIDIKQQGKYCVVVTLNSTLLLLLLLLYWLLQPTCGF